jgi:CheY-like chemotaxis protein
LQLNEAALGYMRSQVLLVESDSQASSVISGALGDAGFTVTALASFEEATVSAAKSRPDLLIAGVRLGRFNGLHLAARFRADYPGLPIIILGHEGDVVLAAEAIQLRARFVPKTTAPRRLLSFVDDLLAGRAPRDLVSTRRWQRRPTSLPIRLSQLNALAIDVGYGGMRVESMTPVDIDAPIDVTLPTVGIDVTGIFRWSKQSSNAKSWWCGFELDSLSTDTRKWRRIVDSLPTSSQ